MSLPKTKSRGSKWPKRKPARSFAPYTPAETFGDQQVLRFGDWCRLNGLSERTGRRILAGANGPVVTKLSKKIFGVTVAHNKVWQASRERRSA
jgi:hypothetical protein